MYATGKRYYERGLDLIERGEIYFCVGLLALTALIGVGEVFSRYALNRSVPQTYEVMLLLATWVYFIGFAVVFKRNEDVVMEYFFLLFPRRARAYIDWAGHVAILVFLVYLFREGLTIYRLGSLTYNWILPVRQSFLYVPVLVSTASLILIVIHLVWTKTEALFLADHPGDTVEGPATPSV
jgi:TRAP-type C4-dicarboxylate transport system permease small subunit